MKIISFNEINKCIRTTKNLLTSGIYNIYGRGKKDLIITKNTFSEGDTVESMFNPINNNQTLLEFNNLTIGEDVSIPVTNNDQTAYIRVNGTLTVNGHLHMDNRGGYISSKETAVSGSGYDITYTYNTAKSLFDDYKMFNVSGNTSCLNRQYCDLVNYGMQETFLNCMVSLPGAGPVGKYRRVEETKEIYEDPVINIRDYQKRTGWLSGDWTWKDNNAKERYYADKEAATHIRTIKTYFNDYYNSISYISGGGGLDKLPTPEDNVYLFGGCGGGTLAIYAESVINMGKKFSENDREYPLNIHANGGSSYSTYNSLNLNILPRGGGTLIIAARHLIIGEDGSITCDGGDGNGLMSLAGREPNTLKYMYSSGNPNVYTSAFTGGAGFAYIFNK